MKLSSVGNAGASRRPANRRESLSRWLHREFDNLIAAEPVNLRNQVGSPGIRWLAIKTKIAPIVGRRDVKALTKSPAKSIGALKADRVSDGIDRKILGGQPPPRFIQPTVAHKDAGRLLESRLKTPHEMTRGEACSLGQRRDRESRASG